MLKEEMKKERLIAKRVYSFNMNFYNFLNKRMYSFQEKTIKDLKKMNDLSKKEKIPEETRQVYFFNPLLDREGLIFDSWLERLQLSSDDSLKLTTYRLLFLEKGFQMNNHSVINAVWKTEKRGIIPVLFSFDEYFDISILSKMMKDYSFNRLLFIFFEKDGKNLKFLLGKKKKCLFL